MAVRIPPDRSSLTASAITTYNANRQFILQNGAVATFANTTFATTVAGVVSGTGGIAVNNTTPAARHTITTSLDSFRKNRHVRDRNIS